MNDLYELLRDAERMACKLRHTYPELVALNTVHEKINQAKRLLAACQIAETVFPSNAEG